MCVRVRCERVVLFLVKCVRSCLCAVGRKVVVRVLGCLRICVFLCVFVCVQVCHVCVKCTAGSVLIVPPPRAGCAR